MNTNLDLPKVNYVLDRIFYINLDRRLERDQNVKSELTKHNLLNIPNMVDRISAVDGSQLDLDTVPNTIITSDGIINAKSKTGRVGISLTPGAIGCALSHRKAWTKIRDDPSIQTALILEDDIQLEKDFVPILKYYLETVKNKYDVLFLGYHPATIKYMQINKMNESELFFQTSKVYGLFGYVVTKNGAKKLLKIFPNKVKPTTVLLID